MNFQRIILIIALIFLVIITVILFYSVGATLKKKSYITNESNCPDYWIDSAGNGTACVGALYNISPGEECYGVIDFSKMSNCDKYNRMNKCKLNWNGINYGNAELKQTCPSV
jgi:Plasmodium falciparum domain of unknown function (CPW_WPC)